MGLLGFVQSAVASVSKTLTGRKRKAPDAQREEEDEQAGLLPPPPPSTERPLLKPPLQRQQADLPARAPLRLDFSSPVVKHPHLMDGSQAGHQTRPPEFTIRLGGQHQQPNGLQQQPPVPGNACAVQVSDESSPGAGVRHPSGSGNPFAKQFAPPRVTPRNRSSNALVNNVRDVRRAPPSYGKLGLTPAAAQTHKQTPPAPGQLGQTRGLFTSQQTAAGPLQHGFPLHQSQQQQQQRHRQGLAAMQRVQHAAGGLGFAARSAIATPSNSQDAALLKRAVEVTLRQEEQQQQQQQQQQQRDKQHPLREEVDLTAEPSSSQQTSQQPRPRPAVVPAPGRGFAAAAAGAARELSTVVHWRAMLQRVVEQGDALEGMGDEQVLQPLEAPSEAQRRYEESVAAVQQARKRELETQRQALRFMSQLHTAAERAQPHRAQQLEAKIEQVTKQLQELQANREQRQQQQAVKLEQRRPLPAQKPAPAHEADGLVDLLSSDEEEAAQAEEGEGKPEVRRQLERFELAEEGRALLPIPDDWRVEYEAALAPGDPGEVLCDHPRSSIALTRRDFACMAPLQWLNDEVINLYVALLLERDARRRKQGKGPRCHFFSTFFANKLYKDAGYAYDQVRRWTLPKRLSSAGQASGSILDVDRVVIPVHQGLHWVCAVIDLQHRKFVYYDSLKGEDHKCLEQLSRYLRDEYANKRGEKRDDVLEWPREFPKRIPRQHNGCDCGVFTLLFARHAGADAPMDFTQADIDDLRVRIVHELLHLRVD